MSRKPAKVTQADISRAIRAVEQTGAALAIVICPDGEIRLEPPLRQYWIDHRRPRLSPC